MTAASFGCSTHHFYAPPCAALLLQEQSMIRGDTVQSSRSAACRVVVLAAVLVVGASSCSTPQSEAARAQQVLEIGDAVNATKNEISEMRGTLDSLRVVVAKQDTTIARLANVTGVVVLK
ncbi:MAG: hypothetical protein WCL36_01305 [bacterium]